MDTLGKFKTNFLKDGGSFKIGFNNRSPLSQVGYKAKYVAPGSSVDNPDFSSQIPKLGSSLDKEGNSILAPSNEAALTAIDFIGDSIAETGEELADSIGKNIERKKEENFNKIVDNLPEHYDNWKKENPSKTKEDYNKEFSKHIEAFKKTHQFSQDHQGKLGFDKK